MITANGVGFSCRSIHLQSFSLHQLVRMIFLSHPSLNRIHPKRHVGFETVYTYVIQLMHRQHITWVLTPQRLKNYRTNVPEIELLVTEEVRLVSANAI